MYKCRCRFIFILRADVPRFSCDISIHAKDNCFCCEKKNYHYYSTFGVIGVLHENVSLTYNC